MPLLLPAIPMSFASSDLLPVARNDCLSRGDPDTLSSLPVNGAIDRVPGSDHFPSVSPFGEPSSVAKATENGPFRWAVGWESRCDVRAYYAGRERGISGHHASPSNGANSHRSGWSARGVRWQPNRASRVVPICQQVRHAAYG